MARRLEAAKAQGDEALDAARREGAEALEHAKSDAAAALAAAAARHLVVGALAFSGFAYQTTGIGPALPFFVRWPLLPFRASEACLASLAYGIRAADARAA